jgi:hypothetical protein
VPHPDIHVDQADDLAAVLQRRRQHGLDPRQPDGLRQGDARSARRVHQEEAVLLLDDRGDERLGQPDVLGRDPLGDAHDRRHELARHRERRRTTARSERASRKTLSIRNFRSSSTETSERSWIVSSLTTRRTRSA